MKGYVHSIETFGTVDGPGVRFVVFFQGCSLRCLYCHNPDTWCGGGTPYEASELIEKMARNLPFYETGGITASGGEPMLQLDFLTELFSLAKKEGISTCLDTSGIVFDRENKTLTKKIDTLLSLCDLVMLDIKHIDETEHIKLTGHSNKSVLDFARYLNEKCVKMRVRHVIVPELTFKDEYLLSLGEFLSSFDNIEKIEVLPFHQLGRVKYENLGIDYELKDTPALTQGDAKYALEIIERGMKKQ